MRKDIEKRLRAVETRESDWISQLTFIDYDSDEDYDSGDWEEVYRDNPVTVYRHIATREVRGVYDESRTVEEILDVGGDPAYL